MQHSMLMSVMKTEMVVLTRVQTQSSAIPALVVQVIGWQVTGMDVMVCSLCCLNKGIISRPE